MCRLRLGALLLVLLSTTTAATRSPFLNVYQECTTPDGVVGRCRGEAQAALAAEGPGRPAVKGAPIDMSFPCANGRKCAENVDAAEVPVRLPYSRSCSVLLMPWSAFPCTYNTDVYQGVSDQNTTNLCYTAANKPSGPEYVLATALTTNGYDNVYEGIMPESPCLDDSSDYSGVGYTTARRRKRPPPGVTRGGAAVPGFGRNFARVLLVLDFRVAAGRQFDRTYVLQIGSAVAAFGTLSEPTRFLGTDKTWSTTVDVTHLQAYFAPGQATRFSIGNVLTDVYNVPLWASASLEFYWDTPPPSSSSTTTTTAAGTASTTTAAAAAAIPASSSSSRGSVPQAVTPAHYGEEARVRGVGADVPHEVLPLVLPDAGPNSLVNLVGTGDRPEHWPRVTFSLPRDLSDARNIYRAQLLVVPKADACEEFWAMTPSGIGTNSTCGGLSTGEPYREVRVYVNGQLAGFSPVFYTMYTGGIDPRLWSAIVAAYAYSLPIYTFDLSPWLPQLNTPPGDGDGGTFRKDDAATTTATATGGSTASSSSSSSGTSSGAVPQQQQQQQQQGRSSGQELQPAASRRLAATHASADPQPGSADQRLPSNAATRVSGQQPAGCSGAGCAQHVPVQQQQQQQAGQQQPEAHTITVELGGATGSDWVVASTLLLWRATQPNGEPVVVTGDQEPSLLLSQGFDAPLQSDCQAAPGAAVAVAGRCTLQLQNRGMSAAAALQLQGREWQARVQYVTKRFDSSIAYNNSVIAVTDGDGSLLYDQHTTHEASWSVTRLAEQAAAVAEAPAAAVTVSSNDDDVDVAERAGSIEEGAAAAAPQADDAMRSSRVPDVLTRSDVRYEWQQAGGIFTGAVYETSFNFTLLEPAVFSTPAGHGGEYGAGEGGGAAAARTTVGRGRQRHYARAVMVDVYDPQHPVCVVPDHPTHTVSLHSSVKYDDVSSERKAARQHQPCLSRTAAAAFCAANLTVNDVDMLASGC